MKQKGKKIMHFPFQKELIELLEKEMPLHSVFVISANKYNEKHQIYLAPIYPKDQLLITYTLLIICYKPFTKRIEDLINEVYNKMHQLCKMYPIIYSLSTFKKKIKMGDNFLSRIRTQTICIYKKNEILIRYPHLQPNYHNTIYEKIESDWLNRMERSRYLLSIIDIDSKEDYVAKLATMNNALEQVCLGLLYVFWEFKPNHYVLSYLLHLCSHFTNLPNKVFPQTTFGLQRQFYMLCNASQIMRFKSKNEFSEQDAIKVQHRSRLFFEEAKTLGQVQLKHLKVLHCKEKF